ncbi:MAG: hypothetical protein OXH75_26640 [Acidobacteria bacterium]|nr:hypothetical protein [Acidobacteriota bacterium]
MSDTSETEKREYQKKLGEDFGTILYELRNDWLTGLVRLKEYRVLFTDREAVGLLNAAGGAFTWDIQQIFWSDLLLHVTRLTDPATMGRHENLSVQALPPFCERPEVQAEHPELHAMVLELVTKAVTAADGPRKWRNRRISHADLGLAIDPNAESLAPTSLQQVQAALDSVHAVIQAIAGQVLNHHIINDIAVRPRAGAFLGYLKQLIKAVQYVDAIIDPGGNAAITDVGLAENFVRRVGRRPDRKEIFQVIDLREAARSSR